jgi:hypothetical protein
MILADEPTGNLDSRAGIEIMQIFQELNRLRQVTIMLVTHDPRIAAYCQRRLSLHNGKIVSDGMAQTRHLASMGSGGDGHGEPSREQAALGADDAGHHHRRHGGDQAGAVAEGAKRYITHELSGLGTNLLIITAGKSQTTGGPPILGEGTRKLTYEDAMAIEQATNRSDIAPVIIGVSMITYGNRSRDITVVGTTYAHQRVRNIFVEVGRFISDEDVESRRRVVALGRTMARELFGEIVTVHVV